MKTDCFDAVVNISPVDREKPLQAQILIQEIKIPASFYFYEPALAEKPGISFVRIHCQEPLLLKWKDIFKVKGLKGKDLLEEGLVLLTCGTYDNIIRWIPPLIIKDKELEEALNIFDKVMERIG